MSESDANPLLPVIDVMVKGEPRPLVIRVTPQSKSQADVKVSLPEGIELGLSAKARFAILDQQVIEPLHQAIPNIDLIGKFRMNGPRTCIEFRVGGKTAQEFLKTFPPIMAQRSI